MRTKQTIHTLSGSILVYVIVAACSSSGDGGFAGADGGSGGEGGRGDEGGLVADAMHVADSLVNPVADAKADVEQSGARLKAKHYVGADGSTQFAGWHDTQLDVDCVFLNSADGSLRCLPAFPFSAAFVGPFFGDSGCSQPLAYQYTGCVVAKYAQAAVAGSCSVQPNEQIYAIAGAFSGTVYEGTPASCTALPGSMLSMYSFYSLGSVVPASSFVQATVKVDP